MSLDAFPNEKKILTFYSSQNFSHRKIFFSLRQNPLPGNIFLFRSALKVKINFVGKERKAYMLNHLSTLTVKLEVLISV